MGLSGCLRVIRMACGGLMETSGAYPQSAFRLGNLYVDPSKNLIEFPHGARAIQPKLMEVLCFLCARSGQVISAETLLEGCWSERFISDNSVHKTIAQLRKQLGDTSKRSRYIKTIPKKGYSIVAKVVGLTAINRPVSPRWTGQSPYPGSRPFRLDEQEIFFGRDQVIAMLCDWVFPRLGKSPESSPPEQMASQSVWLSLYGPAGCGKTSLIQAGLLARISERGTCLTSGGANFCYLDLSARGQEELVRPLIDFLIEQHILLAGASFVYEDLTDTPSVDASSAQAGEELTGCIDYWWAPTKRQHRAVICIDHLDTVFGVIREQEVGLFLSVLDALVETGKCLLITAMRGKFLACIDRRSQCHANAFQYELPPLSKSEIVDTIQRPAAAAGLAFQYHSGSRERLDTFLIHQQQVDPFPLAVLQRLLACLYDDREGNMLTYPAFEKSGGLAGSLAEFAEQAFQKLPQHMQNVLETMLFDLLQLNAAGEALMPVSHVPYSEFSQSAEQGLIRPMTDSSVFIEGQGDEASTFCLSHPTLLTHWPWLKKWADQHIDQFYLHHDIGMGTDRWLYHGRDSAFLMDSEQSLKKVGGLIEDGCLHINADEHDFIVASRKKLLVRAGARVGGFVTLLCVIAAFVFLTGSLLEQGEQLQKSRRNAENLISAMLYDLKDKLEPLGKLDLLEAVGAEARLYFADRGTDGLSPSGRAQWAASLNILAQVRVDKLEYDDALILFEESERTLGSAIEAGSEHIGVLEQAMLANYGISNVHFRRKDHERALPYLEAYLDITRRLQTLEPDKAKWKLETSYALTNLGSVAARTGRLQAATEYFARSADIKSALLKDSPGDTSLRDGLANTMSWQASALERVGSMSEALGLRQMALNHAYHLTRSEPENYKWIQRIAILEHRTALTQYHQGELARSLAHSQRAEAYLARLLENDPSNHRHKNRLFWNQLHQARVFRNSGEYDKSLVRLNVARDLSAIPELATDPRLDALLLLDQARLYASLGQLLAARATIERAIDEFGKKRDHRTLHTVLYAELLLAKADILDQMEVAPKQGFTAALKGAQIDMMAILDSSEREPKHATLYMALARYTGQTAGLTPGGALALNAEYRNPDFVQQARQER